MTHNRVIIINAINCVIEVKHLFIYAKAVFPTQFVSRVIKLTFSEIVLRNRYLRSRNLLEKTNQVLRTQVLLSVFNCANFKMSLSFMICILVMV